MTSINKLVPSIASGSLEIAPALANLNFDFALWKVAAPKEFEGVGSALSASRREEAEGGRIHTIARKLGALFEKKVPATPGLTKTYGTRASEIARFVSLDDRGRKSYGVFASRAGPDATSLWAAATSGTSAISIHLLACLLARIWDAPEAISIWVEVVKRRKEEIIAEFDETDIAHLATLAAARQDLPRAQIAEWDDSARAWLRIADTVKNKQQKQLMLILDNVQSPINAKTDTYDSVMEAWTSSLTQMEALVQGISQQARSGETLLALSSWHLYPDLTVVAPSMAHVRQNDPLFGSGGMLTIGLETPISRGNNGVHWSLPLAYLRHYGRPVASTCSINSASRSRLSLPELLQATLGALLQKWGPAGEDTSRSLNWIWSIYHILKEDAKIDRGFLYLRTNVTQHCWLALLSEAADRYLASSGLERQHNNKLISLGRRQAHVFLGTPSEPNFGLLEKGRFVSMITHTEDKIAYLRKVGKLIAEEMRLDGSQIIIRYRHQLSNSLWVPEYATVIPMTKVKPPADFVAQYCVELQTDREVVLDRLKFHLIAQGQYHDEAFAQRRKLLETAGESVFSCKDQLIGEISPHNGVYWCNLDGSSRCSTPWYRYMYGDIDDAALFITKARDPNFVNVVLPARASANEMYSLFESNKMDSLKTIGQLDSYLRQAKVDVDPYIKSLKAISTAATMYAHFPHASVDVRILQQNLYDVSWVRTCISPSDSSVTMFPEGSFQALQPYVLTDGQAFACLAMFESGQYNIDPDQLADVVAMCSGDSIFVRAALLADPHERLGSGEIRGLMGNIGRPGITFLVPPKAPLLKEVSLDEWPLIEHNDFDGCVLDNFQNTSLHLSFTTAEAPLNTGFSGGQDQVACILEAVFSVYDGGRWVADLNISNLATTWLRRMHPCTSQHAETTYAPPKLTCIDSWLGLINAPAERISLLRANRNWQARLAASSISLALGHETVILPDDACWHCLHQYASSGRYGHGQIIAIG